VRLTFQKKENAFGAILRRGRTGLLLFCKGRLLIEKKKGAMKERRERSRRACRKKKESSSMGLGEKVLHGLQGLEEMVLAVGGGEG